MDRVRAKFAACFLEDDTGGDGTYGGGRGGGGCRPAAGGKEHTSLLRGEASVQLLPSNQPILRDEK
jgi:hypothetical protein